MQQFKDTITCEILEDGTISVSTDQISKENHISADKMLNETFQALGGEKKVVKRAKGAHSHHSHIQGHVHNH